MIEEWKTIEGFSRYKVSPDGEIFDTKENRNMPQCVNGGFSCCNLIGDDGKKVLCKVHRLVAFAYIETPENAHKVVHKDGDRNNNSTSNLSWKLKKVKEALTKPKPITYQGTEYSYRGFAELSGVAVDTLKARINAGWSLRECFTGFREFTGMGIQTLTHWFPTELEKNRHEVLSRKILRIGRQEAEEERLNSWRNRERVIAGVGLLDIEVSSYNPIYRRWVSLLGRCYNESSLVRAPSYRDKDVCQEWFLFSNFKAWMEQQDWEGLELDKDILIKGNKLYSPEACVFVPDYVNSALCLSDRARGQYPVGVVYHKKDKVYRAHIKSLGVRKDLGSYSTPECAHQSWQKAKVVELENIISRYSMESCFKANVAAALMQRIWDIRLDILNENITTTL